MQGTIQKAVPMFHEIALLTALSFLCAGTILEISAWSRHTVGPQKEELRGPCRVAAALRAIVNIALSRKVLTAIKAFLLEVTFQSGTLKEDTLRWLMHMFIFSGFTSLFFLHALDNLVTTPHYSAYAPTLSSFLFPRDAGGALIILGTALAVHRRFIQKAGRPLTNRMDIAAMVMVGFTVASGFGLEAAKITSRSTF